MEIIRINWGKYIKFNKVQVIGKAPLPNKFVGKFIDIATDAEPNGYFEITSAQNLGDGKWKFGVGDCSFVTGFVDREAKEKGYTYIISENANCTITM